MITAEAESATATAAAEEPKGTKKARAGRQGAHVAPKKGKPAKKATPAKKAPKSAKKKPGASAETVGRRHAHGTDEGYRVASPFCKRILVGGRGQKAGSDCYVH